MKIEEALKIVKSRKRTEHPQYMEAQKLVANISFNNKLLEVGDSVIIVYGRHLRNSIISEITSDHFNQIKVEGIKTYIQPKSIIKLE